MQIKYQGSIIEAKGIYDGIYKYLNFYQDGKIIYPEYIGEVTEATPELIKKKFEEYEISKRIREHQDVGFYATCLLEFAKELGFCYIDEEW